MRTKLKSTSASGEPILNDSSADVHVTKGVASLGAFVSFAVIVICYAFWNILQRTSNVTWTINQLEWIVIDKGFGSCWLLLMFAGTSCCRNLQAPFSQNNDRWSTVSNSNSDSWGHSLAQTGEAGIGL